MADNTLKVAFGVDFALIGTDLKAIYEKDGSDYAILLAPSAQKDNQGITIQELIDDIKSITGKVTGEKEVDTEKLETAIKSAVEESGTEPSEKSVTWSDVRIRLQMAYLYISKKNEQSDLEYAFQLEVLTEGLIPKEIKGIIDVKDLSVSVWNTDRKKILDQMSLMTVSDFLELPDRSEE